MRAIWHEIWNLLSDEVGYVIVGCEAALRLFP